MKQSQQRFAFAVVAHVDHGKTTLCQSLASYFYKNFEGLDNLEVEQRKNITVKLKQFSFFIKNKEYFFIDTPGHEDFFEEVERSLNITENVLLLIDSRQGIQSQTLKILPLLKDKFVILVWTKTDLTTDIDLKAQEQNLQACGLNYFTSVHVSAKNKSNFEQLLSLFEFMHPIQTQENNIFDIHFSKFGYYCYLKTKDLIKKNQFLFFQSNTKIKILKLYKRREKLEEIEQLENNDIGIALVKANIEEINTGIFYLTKQKQAGTDISVSNALMFCQIFSLEKGVKFDKVINNLFINDPSISNQIISHSLFGSGYILGFRGKLHLDVFLDRLKSEYTNNLLITDPNFIFKYSNNGQKPIYLKTADDFLPIMKDHLEEICQEFKIILDINLIDKVVSYLRIALTDVKQISTTDIVFGIALSKMNAKFLSDIKEITSGHYMIEKHEEYWLKSNIGLFELQINTDKISNFTRLINFNEVKNYSSMICEAVAAILNQRNFRIKVYGLFNGKVMSSGEKSARPNAVTSKCYGGGGDATRKQKLLNNQKEGRKNAKQNYKFNLTAKDFEAIFKKIK